MAARLRRVPTPLISGLVGRGLAELHLAEYARVRARVLSSGNRQRLGLAGVLQHDPDLIVLDEPPSALDSCALCAAVVGERGPSARLSPRVYVERLMGRRVGRSGNVRCPFHEDRTPSLYVYASAAEGWYCFGCWLSWPHGHPRADGNLRWSGC